jgi:uncharacterized cupin superfamily protein
MDYQTLILNQSALAIQSGSAVDADFTRAFKNQKLAVHWVTLKPGQRTSIPHAESLEEEVVYVISGNPHVWINGFIYPLHTGHVVGFPAGTGIGHTFLNNTFEDVVLAVLGEKTKRENKALYVINPELEKDFSEMWWHDWPRQEMGPHDGKPGNVEHQRLAQDLGFICDVNACKRSDSFSYPGDTETFTEGLRITKEVGLKVLGLWHEKLHPGKRASWPHAHKIEEEFCLILEGHPHVWLNGFLFEMSPGDCVYFPPGTNMAHTLLNNSKAVVEYLSIGQVDGGGSDEKLIYPLHSGRNLQCKEKGELWEDAPMVSQMGSHDGKPDSF